MNYKLKDIVYESGKYWVLKVKTGFEVYKVGVTCSTRCAQIGGQDLSRAVNEVSLRERDEDTHTITKECAHCGLVQEFKVFNDYNGQPLTCLDLFACDDRKKAVQL